jgi:2-polyprenyl-3-methyl-5-hydroxy-6-metoxy-1,4-benzoquinol methylase
MNVLDHNRAAWNRKSREGDEWTVGVDRETIRKAAEGDWSVVLTPVRSVPREWFGDLRGKDVLCLASGGGQQAPIFAAAGARVTSFDLSDAQLATDQAVAEQNGLSIRCLRGNMADLSVFGGEEFDLIFHPISNVFAPDVLPVWKECHRVLRPGGALLAGFMNPSVFLFDYCGKHEAGGLVAKYRLPYSDFDLEEGSPQLEAIRAGDPIEFSHSLETQIGGQLAAGFMLTALYEDWWTKDKVAINKFTPMSIATRAVKPVRGAAD